MHMWVYKYVSELFCRAAKCSLPLSGQNTKMTTNYSKNTWNYEGVLKSLDADDSFAAQLSEFYLYGLKKLEQQSKKCVELRGEYNE